MPDLLPNELIIEKQNNVEGTIKKIFSACF